MRISSSHRLIATGAMMKRARQCKRRCGNVAAMSAPLHLGLTPWLAPLARRADELSRQAVLAGAVGL